MLSLCMTVKSAASSTASHLHVISVPVRISISRGKNLWYDESGYGWLEPYVLQTLL